MLWTVHWFCQCHFLFLSGSLFKLFLGPPYITRLFLFSSLFLSSSFYVTTTCFTASAMVGGFAVISFWATLLACLCVIINLSSSGKSEPYRVSDHDCFTPRVTVSGTPLWTFSRHSLTTFGTILLIDRVIFSSIVSPVFVQSCHSSFGYSVVYFVLCMLWDDHSMTGMPRSRPLSSWPHWCQTIWNLCT